MKSVMQHSFAQVPRAEIQRSKFDRSHGYKTTCDAGLLIPFFLDEALPGDTFSVDAAIMARMATPAVPIMDNLTITTFFFAVPYRLVWTNFVKMCGEQTDPGDSTSYIFPTVTTAAGFSELELYDYFGVPTSVAGLEINNLAARAYNLIWNQWFRDENLQDSVVVDLDDGPDDEADYVLLRRGKRHDYFTSCLPWAQKGTAIDLPLGASAVVKTSSSTLINGGQARLALSKSADGASITGPWTLGVSNSGLIFGGSSVSESGGAYPRNLYADLSNATAASIGDLREAFQLQRMMEKDARGGTRYTEMVKAHFGVTSPDARLQRAEFLGGRSDRIMITPVAQTGETGSTPQGNLAAYATAMSNGNGFTKSFTEHCVVIGLLCIDADLTYQQGLPRMFSRSTRWDMYWPALANLGEQEVLSKEIYCDGTGSDDDVFGYQERYAEYRYKPSQITGALRSNYSGGSLDVWHLSEDFASRPTLSAAFIESNPPIDRVVAVVDEPHFIVDTYNRFTAVRPMPTYAVPGLIDHF